MGDTSRSPPLKTEGSAVNLRPAAGQLSSSLRHMQNTAPGPTFPLRQWRAARRLTAAQLAERAGLSPTYISHLETGKRRYNQDSLEALAKALDCSPGDLLAVAPPPPPIVEVEPWAHPERPEGHYIRAWRQHRNLPLRDLAALAGMTEANLSRLERGLVPYTQRTLEKIATALGTDPAALIGVSPENGVTPDWLSSVPEAKRKQLIRIAEILNEDHKEAG